MLRKKTWQPRRQQRKQRQVMRDAPHDQMRDVPHHQMRDAPHHQMRDAPHDQMRDAPHDQMRNVPLLSSPEMTWKTLTQMALEVRICSRKPMRRH